MCPAGIATACPSNGRSRKQYRKKKLNKDEVPVKEFRAECRAYAQHWVNVPARAGEAARHQWAIGTIPI
jgi:hypothetical protein